MNILVIHQQFLRPGEGGGSRFNEFTRMWTEAGHAVTVIAGQTSYSTGTCPPGYQRRWVNRECQDGVTVLRTYTADAEMVSTRSRIWSFLSFMLSSTWAALALVRCPDVIIATSPQLVVAVPGILASVRHRRPLVFEVRDLWPESGIALGGLREGSLTARLLYALEAWAYRRAAAINVLTPAFRDNIVRRGLAPEEKIWLIPNGADFAIFSRPSMREEVRAQHGWQGKFVLLYAGAHGPANDLMQLVRAADVLRGESEVVFVTAGAGAETPMLTEEIRRRGLTNMHLLGNIPKAEMPRLLAAADVGLAVLKKCDTFKTVYPNKVFDYMSLRLPVLTTIDGIARQLVEDAGAGIYADAEDTDAICHAARWLRDHPHESAEMGERGYAYVKATFDRAMLAERYLDSIETLLAGGRARGS